MVSFKRIARGLCILAAVLSFNSSARAEEPIRFEDATEKAGLAKYLEKWTWGHSASWGDANGDGLPDLYIGAFAEREPYLTDVARSPNLLFLNDGKGGLVLSEDKGIRLQGKKARTTGGVFVDLDNDVDMDLVVSSHASNANQFQSVIFENLGGGKFRQAEVQGDWPTPLGLRNVGVMDLDNDGLLDLILTDNKYSYYKKDTGRLHVLRNKGRFTFEDVTERLGLPMTETMGNGLALGDVNNDGVLDIFVGDSLRLFVSGPDGKYRQCQRDLFVKPKNEFAPGADLGDLNGDGLLDVVTTIHDPPTALHIYLNQGITDGMPTFVEITAQLGQDKLYPPAGPTGEPIKTTHVAIQDFDNDGRCDIFTPIIWQDESGGFQPLVLRNLGNSDGLPRFTLPPYERLFGYYAPGPVADYDGDGLLDTFLPTWGVFTKSQKVVGLDAKPEIPSYLFRNVTQGGHWLIVRVAGKAAGRNPMGVGATVRVYEAGFAGDAGRLLGRHDITLSNGWSSANEPLAHFGLGKADKCDVVVTWGKAQVRQEGVSADRKITIPFDK